MGSAAKSQLQGDEQWFRAVAQSATDAIVSIDSEGKIVFWNRAAETIFGYSADETLGKSLTLVLPARFRQAHRQGLKRVAAGGRSHIIGKTVEMIGLRKDSSEFPIELSLSSWQTTGVTFFTGIVREITARKQAEEEIKKLNQDLELRATELKAANKELEAFSYSISHDLRAPLRAIDGFSRMLIEKHWATLTPDVQHCLTMVRESAQEMGQLIDKLLTFSRLTRQPLKTQAVAPGDLARQVVEDLRPESEGRRVEVSIGDLPPCQADPTLLKQVFSNLLSNAFKFTRSRELARIEVGGQEVRGERIYFVKDNGVGFDMRYADKLFGVFHRSGSCPLLSAF